MDTVSAQHSPLGRPMFILRFVLIPSACALLSCLFSSILNLINAPDSPVNTGHFLTLATIIIVMASIIFKGSIDTKATAKGAAICFAFTLLGTLVIWAMTTFSVDSKLIAFVNFFIVAPLTIFTLMGIYKGADQIMFDGDKYIISRK